jgi:hypothetical protein
MAQERRRRYTVSPQKYQEMAIAQGGLCLICQKPEITIRLGKTRQLSVDHNHATQQVRGLLCAKCNQGLGLFKDDPARLLAASNYLEGVA